MVSIFENVLHVFWHNVWYDCNVHNYSPNFKLEFLQNQKRLPVAVEEALSGRSPLRLIIKKNSKFRIDMLFFIFLKCDLGFSIGGQ